MWTIENTPFGAAVADNSIQGGTPGLRIAQSTSNTPKALCSAMTTLLWKLATFKRQSPPETWSFCRLNIDNRSFFLLVSLRDVAENGGRNSAAGTIGWLDVARAGELLNPLVLLWRLTAYVWREDSQGNISTSEDDRRAIYAHIEGPWRPANLMEAEEVLVKRVIAAKLSTSPALQIEETEIAALQALGKVIPPKFLDEFSFSTIVTLTPENAKIFSLMVTVDSTGPRGDLQGPVIDKISSYMKVIDTLESFMDVAVASTGFAEFFGKLARKDSLNLSRLSLLRQAIEADDYIKIRDLLGIMRLSDNRTIEQEDFEASWTPSDDLRTLLYEATVGDVLEAGKRGQFFEKIASRLQRDDFLVSPGLLKAAVVLSENCPHTLQEGRPISYFILECQVSYYWQAILAGDWRPELVSCLQQICRADWKFASLEKYLLGHVLSLFDSTSEEKKKQVDKRFIHEVERGTWADIVSTKYGSFLSQKIGFSLDEGLITSREVAASLASLFAASRVAVGSVDLGSLNGLPPAIYKILYLLGKDKE